MTPDAWIGRAGEAFRCAGAFPPPVLAAEDLAFPVGEGQACLQRTGPNMNDRYAAAPNPIPDACYA